MNYSLAKKNTEKPSGVLTMIRRRILPLMTQEKKRVTIAIVAVLVTSATTLMVPMIIAHIVDTYLAEKDFQGVLVFSGILLIIFILGTISSYIQIVVMGGVGRRLLFNLRNKLFNKLQELPIAFFNQNKTGDLISRINSDTDKLNQFFSQALMQFVGNIALIIGTGIFIIFINFKLGTVSLLPALLAILLTQILSPWVKERNLKSLKSLGNMSSEVQESIANFKVVVAFNRLDYFRKKFKKVNEENYKASILAGVASNIFNPIYILASALAQLAVLIYGIHLIRIGEFSIGMLIGFLLYVNNFYNPLRQLATVWSSLQLALAGLDRIYEVFNVESNIKLISAKNKKNFSSDEVLEFENVSFGYRKNEYVLKNINFTLKKGKTYALVGPTGGGKTTTASLMARLFDPNQGIIYLMGKDIRSFEPEERADKIGFILQDPFLFNGTVRENILYGNEKYQNYTDAQLEKVLKEFQLEKLIYRFKEGLKTVVASGGDTISLGQKQLIAFIRAVLRNPTILILDEATANIDTVTEQLLEEIINKLPKETVKIIIAHRLNTIENADEIFFVNSGEVTCAGSMQQAVDMLLNDKSNS